MVREQLLGVTHLTILLRNTDNVISDPIKSFTRHLKFRDHILDRSVAMSENKSGSGSTAYASVNTVFDVAKESSDVFLQLKSAASGLAVILKYYDVWCIFMGVPTILTVAPASDG